MFTMLTLPAGPDRTQEQLTLLMAPEAQKNGVSRDEQLCGCWVHAGLRTIFFFVCVCVGWGGGGVVFLLFHFFWEGVHVCACAHGLMVSLLYCLDFNMLWQLGANKIDTVLC